MALKQSSNREAAAACGSLIYHLGRYESGKGTEEALMEAMLRLHWWLDEHLFISGVSYTDEFDHWDIEVEQAV